MWVILFALQSLDRLLHSYDRLWYHNIVQRGGAERHSTA